MKGTRKRGRGNVRPGAAVLPEVLVHNTGWVIALGTVLMIGAVYLLHRIEKR